MPFEIDPDKRTVLLTIGPSGAAGKDTVLDQAVKEGLPIQHVVTATTRKRRFIVNNSHRFEEEYIKQTLDSIWNPEVYQMLMNMWANMGKISPTEPYDKYVWMRGKLPDETDEEYFNYLRTKHALIEWDVHHGNLYGLPKKSIDTVLTNTSVIPFIRTETSGAISLTESLGPYYNVLTVAVLPDNIQQLEEAAAIRENPELRKADNVKIIKDFTKVANSYLHNTRRNMVIGQQQSTGLEMSVRALRSLLYRLKLITND